MAIEPDARRRAHQWRDESYSEKPERDALFETISGHPVEPLYTGEDLAEWDAERDLGHPGEFPYTRGVYPSMYRGRLWTMRQFAGFGTVEETNERFRYLLDHGQTGLSTAFDMPTLMGLDSDHARSLGEVGVEGVALDTVDDMETLFDGIPLDEVTVSMTINAPAAILLAFYVVAAEEKGITPERLGGTIQTDILKEYIAQKEWCFPIDPAMRLVTDMIEWCSAEMPRWHPISISGYHIREAGSTAQQELAFTLKDGFTYVERAIERGLDVDDFAPRLSFFFNAHLDFFEEIAKYRAARRIWAAELRDTYGATSPEALRMRFHTQTAGVSLTAQQPLGEHRPHHDRGARRRPRRDPVAAHQLIRRGTRAPHRGGGADRPAHPAGDRARDRGDEHDRPARRRLLRREAHRRDGGGRPRVLRPDRRARRDGRGGQARLSRSARSPTPPSATSTRSTSASGSSSASTSTRSTTTRRSRSCGSTPRSSESRRAGSAATKAGRDSAAVESALAALKTAAADEGENLMPHFLAAARARASEGEMVAALQEVFGTFTERPVF